MLDIQFIRDNPELVAEKSKQKGYTVDINRLLKLDTDRRELRQKIESNRNIRNQHAKRGLRPEGSDQGIEAGKQLKEEHKRLENELTPIDKEFNDLLKTVPNMPWNDVPVGASEDENVVVKEWGDKPQFDFTAKSHWEIGENREWIDKKRAAKVTGSRFAYLKGDLVRLQFAIVQFVLDSLANRELIAKLIAENNLKLHDKPFTPVLPPVMIREKVYDQMDRLEPREDRYHLDGQDDNLWLIGSAEHTLGSMYTDETLSSNELPVRYVGYSTSFRQEAGTYGKDTEGILRMHQFDKLEMEVFSTPETSFDEHLLLIAIQEHLMQQLGIPYHVLMKCTADIGKPNARGVDIEAWLPGQNAYRETHTADYMTDYQARRLKTRFKLWPKPQPFDAEQRSPEFDTSEMSGGFVHTNDATAFALGRVMIAIIENFQTAEGRVVIPEVLRPFMGGQSEL